MKVANKGFTLIELSVVMVIIGIITVGFLQGNALLLKKKKISKTKEKIEAIQIALQEYLMTNSDLPCPARLDLVEGNNDFGEAGDCSLVANAVILYGGSSQFVYGAVPTQTLNLENEMMKDEWGNKFSYIVYVDYTANGTGFINMDPTASAITVYTEGTSQTITTKAVYAIISHGENGLGGFGYYSGLQANSAGNSASETKNIAQGAFDGSIVSTLYSPNFDDIVYYRTKNQLILDLDWEDVGCYFDTTMRNAVSYDDCDDAFEAVSDNYLDYGDKYEWTYGEGGADCCIAKCYKYGRVGYYLKGEDCD